MPPKKDRFYAFRLIPGNDLKNSIDMFVKRRGISAGWLICCVGSLTEYSIRFANQLEPCREGGHFEIISLTGTVSINGSHLHISIADTNGKTIGGHLMEGCKIYTTAEIILAESGRYIFNRKKDRGTSWKELKISKK